MRPGSTAVLAGSLLLCLFAGSADASPVVLGHARGAVPLSVVADGPTMRLEGAGFGRPIALPARGSVDAVTELGAGWLIAGAAKAENGTELYFLRGDERSEAPLAPPPGRVGAERRSAVPFAGEGKLDGVAWLEGNEERKFDVRFSAFDGERFGAPEVVSPAGPGTQIAPAGLRLPGGKLLLVWAGFDGKDDEIWYAVRGAGPAARWSAPARAADDNATPDITPALVPLDGGALLVWSRFDGSEYRLMSTRFDGGAMGTASWAAEAGSLFPSIERGPKGPALLYRDARDSSWVIAELGADGRLGKSARIVDDSGLRPTVSFDGASVVWHLGERDALSAWQ